MVYNGGIMRKYFTSTNTLFRDDVQLFLLVVVLTGLWLATC
jgi:hypothetical protein